MVTAVREIAPFKNEVIRTFDDPAERASLDAALARARSRFGSRYPVIIDGRRIETERWIRSVNPAKPAEIVGEAGSASLKDADDALEAATRRFQSWRFVPAADRAGFLFAAAELIRQRRDDFNALLILEVGKTPAEADGDTAEAIDFLEFYAREALRLSNAPPLVPIAGEANRLEYIPLGVGIAIPPWNFAFAIMAGMTAAALVSGNTVLLKPSSDSPVVAAMFVDLLHEVGLPPGVVNFVPGSGRTIGDALVGDPRTRFISFTGSKEVGLHITELAAKTQAGQIWIKRVVAEMGGKDAIVVAADADLDAAAEAIVASAFGFSGQKCSACSRAIVDRAIYEPLLQNVVDRTKRIVTSDPALAGATMGPVINEAAMTSILEYIEKGVAEGGRLKTGGKRIGSEGFFIEPTIIADAKPGSTIEQQEIFGPVLAFIEADDFDHALRIANDTEFGLTGSVFSTDDAKLEQAGREFNVGNLYFNRKCTGAFVGAHPFGGFNMSGTDSKAGGYDYLLLFTQAKMISKKLGHAGGGRITGE